MFWKIINVKNILKYTHCLKYNVNLSLLNCVCNHCSKFILIRREKLRKTTKIVTIKTPVSYGCKIHPQLNYNVNRNTLICEERRLNHCRIRPSHHKPTSTLKYFTT